MGNFCYRCMQATVANGVCTKCGELESAGRNNGDNALQPGTQLAKGRVTVGKKLGSGGFGVTYIAELSGHTTGKPDCAEILTERGVPEGHEQFHEGGPHAL